MFLRHRILAHPEKEWVMIDTQEQRVREGSRLARSTEGKWQQMFI